MKSFVKQIVMASLVAVIAVPAVAAEINKGNKSYQTRSTTADQQTVAAAQDKDGQMTEGDLMNIAPAAGGAEDMKEPASQKSMKEEIRLPRKN